MIVILTGDSVIEKSTIFTTLSIIKPEGVEILRDFNLDTPLEKNAVVLQFDMSILENTKAKTKIRKLIKDQKLMFLKLPSIKEYQEIEEAKNNEASILKKNRIPLVEVDASSFRGIGDQLDVIFKEVFNTN